MNIIAVAGKVIFELVKIGGLATINQYTNQQLRNSTNHFIGEVERGVNHEVHKLKALRDRYDDDIA